MHRVLVACLSSAALFLGSVAFVVGGVGIASASQRGEAAISLSGSWVVRIPGDCKSCETIRFDTSNKTFAEHDKRHAGDHGSYSLGHQMLNLLWTGGPAKGTSFAGNYNSAKHAFVGNYKFGSARHEGDLISAG